MQIDRKCINCTSFPCMKEECAKNNVCSKHMLGSEKIIKELEEQWKKI